jgi:hypothetical protein
MARKVLQQSTNLEKIKTPLKKRYNHIKNNDSVLFIFDNLFIIHFDINCLTSPFHGLLKQSDLKHLI